MSHETSARRAIAEKLNSAVVALEEEIKSPGEVVRHVADLLAAIELAFLFGRPKWVLVIEAAGKLAYSLASNEGQWRLRASAIEPFLAESERIAAANLTGLHFQILGHARALLSTETTIHVAEIAKCGCLLAHDDFEEAPLAGVPK